MKVELIKEKPKANVKRMALVEGHCAQGSDKADQTIGTHEHKEHRQRLNRLVGQLQGIGRMLEEGRYCPDILTQTRAAMAAIKALEDVILQGHMEHCVTSAFHGRDPDDVKEKISELIKLFRKRM